MCSISLVYKIHSLKALFFDGDFVVFWSIIKKKRRFLNRRVDLCLWSAYSPQLKPPPEAGINLHSLFILDSFFVSYTLYTRVSVKFKVWRPTKFCLNSVFVLILLFYDYKFYLVPLAKHYFYGRSILDILDDCQSYFALLTLWDDRIYIFQVSPYIFSLFLFFGPYLAGW